MNGIPPSFNPGNFTAPPMPNFAPIDPSTPRALSDLGNRIDQVTAAVRGLGASLEQVAEQQHVLRRILYTDVFPGETGWGIPEDAFVALEHRHRQQMRAAAAPQDTVTAADVDARIAALARDFEEALKRTASTLATQVQRLIAEKIPASAPAPSTVPYEDTAALLDGAEARV